MAKKTNNKNKGIISKIKALLSSATKNGVHYLVVSWQLVLLGAQGFASFKLFQTLPAKNNMSSYVAIVAATALAVNAIVWIAHLLSRNNQPSSEL